jgi:hypothetical protein
MSRAGIDERLADQHSGEPTVASTWEMTAGGEVTVELLDWPPDLFALTNVVLDRSEAFRFALSPVDAWPPPRFSIGRRRSRRPAASGAPGWRVGERHSRRC